MSNDIVVFRFHNQLNVCKNHLQLFKHFNPKVPIYGIFGGKSEEFEYYTKELSDYLIHNYLIKNIADDSKWKDFDLVLFDWYDNFGNTLNFDQLYLLEWDFVLFDSLANAYKEIPKGTASFSGLVPLKRIESKWYWTKHPPLKTEWELLKKKLDEIGFNKDMYATNCPGLSLPKFFFINRPKELLPCLGNDELRFPLYCQLSNTPMADNGFFKKWFSRYEKLFFNCNGLEITEDNIIAELQKKNGRRAFHPIRKEIDLSYLLSQRKNFIFTVKKYFMKLIFNYTE